MEEHFPLQDQSSQAVSCVFGPPVERGTNMFD